MRLKSYSQTHTGLKREVNQDVLLADKDIKLFAVADGMGGHERGEIASALAIKTLHEYMKSAVTHPNFVPDKALPEAFKEANKVVFEESEKNSKTIAGMGTTLVACFFHEEMCYFANIGDSRIYFFKNSTLWRMTEDHSLINHQIKKRLITEDQKSLFLDSNIITKSVGFLPKVEVDLFKKEFSKDSIFLICSDGLHGMIEDSQISEMCKKYPSEELPEHCIQSALDAGGLDNVSVVIIAS